MKHFQEVKLWKAYLFWHSFFNTFFKKSFDLSNEWGGGWPCRPPPIWSLPARRWWVRLSVTTTPSWCTITISLGIVFSGRRCSTTAPWTTSATFPYRSWATKIRIQYNLFQKDTLVLLTLFLFVGNWWY